MNIRSSSGYPHSRRRLSSSSSVSNKPRIILAICGFGCFVFVSFVGILLYTFGKLSSEPSHDGTHHHPYRFAALQAAAERSRRGIRDTLHGQQHHHHHSPPHEQHRIAIILPYTAPSDQAGSIMPYLTTFCLGVEAAAPLVDFVIFHTGILDAWPNLGGSVNVTANSKSSSSSSSSSTSTRRGECPSNVKFVNLHSHAGLAERLLRVMDRTYPTTTTTDNTASTTTNSEGNEGHTASDEETQPRMKRQELLDLITSYIKVNPYGLVEFKPALGHIFQDYLDWHNYTHWGYSDFDVLFGDISRWITPDELTDYDIVTYTYGDQQRLYLRGQFTFHKNDPVIVNQLWRSCDYLTAMDERFAAIVNHKHRDGGGGGGQRHAYHVESAEGCYSASILQRTDIAVKFAVKAWTDIASNDTAYTHGIWLSRSSNSNSQPRRHVLYKQDPIVASGHAKISNLPSNWFETRDIVYKDRTIPLQSEVGTRQRITDPYSDTDKNPHCMYWALPKYQSKLCLRDGLVTSTDTVFWINGELFKQSFENTALQTSGIVTSPLFHFQEWKRAYHAHGPLASMVQSSPVKTFCLTQEGAIPMITKSTSVEVSPSSPLGLSPISAWHALYQDDRSQLPGSMYCILSIVDGSGSKHARCDTIVSWHDDQQTIIASAAPKWNQVDIEQDVTLVLTLQLSVPQTSNLHTLQNMVDHLKVSLQRWHGQPSVVVISVAFIDDAMIPKVLDLLNERLHTDVTDTSLSSSLVAVVVHRYKGTIKAADKLVLSRKALMNMAVDAVPTRWYVSGLELERGLSISLDTAFFAHRTAVSHNQLRGNVFLIPQFGIVELKTPESNPDDGLFLSFNDLLAARERQAIKPLSSFDASCSDSDETVHHIEQIETEWWSESESLLATKSNDQRIEATNQASSFEELQNEFWNLHRSNMLTAMDEAPIMLVDNLGPHTGIRTNGIVREVETFAGPRCFNGLRLAQLAVLGFSFNVLLGAFAVSTALSRSIVPPSPGCRTCSNVVEDDEHILNKIGSNELKRAAKTAILWAEAIGEKS